MIRLIIRAWGVVARRMASDWLMLAAAFVTILLGITLLAAGPIYSDAVTLASVQRLLGDGAGIESIIEVSTRGQPSAYSSSDEIVRQEVADGLAGVEVAVSAQVEAEAFQLPAGEGQGVDIASIQHLEGIEDHAGLVDGAWPAATPEPYQLAVQEPAAANLGLTVGDDLVLVNRQDPSIRVNARIVGVFTANDPGDPFWFGEPLIGTGVTELNFRTHGPFLAAPDSLLTGFAPHSARYRWTLTPDHSQLTVSRIGEMRRVVGALEGRLDAAGAADFTVGTGLANRLAEAETSVVVTRSNVLMLSVQMAVLAGFALVLTVGLLVEARGVETGLLRSRGAGNGQILAVAVMEGLVLALPAALLAPWLALLLLRLLNRVGPLASIGLRFVSEVGPAAYALSFVAGACCLLAVAVPAYRSSRTFNESYIALGRQGARGLGQRIGFDIGLLALAAAAYWQLRTNGVVLSATVEDRFGFDPLLIATPTLGLLAGAALALRAVPLLARLGEWLARSRRSTVPTLSAWQIARRPLRYSRATLLLTMAVGIGFFAASYSSTWALSQRHQAAFLVGADLTVSPTRQQGSIPDLALRAAHATLRGVTGSMPVMSSSGQLTRGGSPTRFFALDAASAPEIVSIRDDLAPTGFAGLMERLAEGRPRMASYPLPSEPVAVSVLLSARLDQPCQDFPDPRRCFPADVAMVIQDGDGLLHRLDMGDLPLGEGPTRLEASLGLDPTSGAARPAYPLSLAGFEVRSVAAFSEPVPVTVVFEGVEVRPAGSSGWEPAGIEMEPGAWEAGLFDPLGGVTFGDALQSRRPSITVVSAPGEALAVRLRKGVQLSTPQSVFFGVRPRGPELPASFPVVVSDIVLAEIGAGVGDTIDMTGLRLPVTQALITGTVDQFPTVEPGTAATVIADLATIQMLNYRPGRPIDRPDQYWLGVEDEMAAAVGARLIEAPYHSLRVVSRAGTEAGLLTDPIALGAIASLSLGFVAAAVIAGVGFAVSAVAAARERMGEFTLLRALGLSRRQLGSWLSIEQTLLAVLGIVFGTVVGLTLVSLVLPLITVTQEGTAVVPTLIVVYPVRTILLIDLAVVLALLGVIAGLSNLVRGQGLAAHLRLGDN